jgi:hypothetical protein
LYADDIETPVNCIICFLEIYKDSKSWQFSPFSGFNNRC